jgi:hypothetical protein
MVARTYALALGLLVVCKSTLGMTHLVCRPSRSLCCLTPPALPCMLTCCCSVLPAAPCVLSLTACLPHAPPACAARYKVCLPPRRSVHRVAQCCALPTAKVAVHRGWFAFSCDKPSSGRSQFGSSSPQAGSRFIASTPGLPTRCRRRLHQFPRLPCSSSGSVWHRALRLCSFAAVVSAVCHACCRSAASVHIAPVACAACSCCRSFIVLPGSPCRCVPSWLLRFTCVAGFTRGLLTCCRPRAACHFGAVRFRRRLFIAALFIALVKQPGRSSTNR